MATKRVIRHGGSATEEWVKRVSAGLLMLSFLVIALCVMGLEASAYRSVMYITFDSIIVFLVVLVLRWVIVKILLTYEEMDGGQG